MSALVTGQEYVAALAGESDRISRAAFLELALRLLPPGGTVFDFGCGPGLDAQTYAAHGHTVHAYDIDAEMCGHFRRTCAREMAAGTVRLVDSMRAAKLPRVDLVTANFAPLNLVPRLKPVFGQFAAMLGGRGRVLAALLNPLHAGDLKYRWWWRGLPFLLVNGQYSVAGAQASITRWLPGRLARAAGAGFSVESIHVPPVRIGTARRVQLHSPADWAAIARARFLFVSFAPPTAPP